MLEENAHPHLIDIMKVGKTFVVVTFPVVGIDVLCQNLHMNVSQMSKTVNGYLMKLLDIIKPLKVRYLCFICLFTVDCNYHKILIHILDFVF